MTKEFSWVVAISFGFIGALISFFMSNLAFTMIIPDKNPFLMATVGSVVIFFIAIYLSIDIQENGYDQLPL